MQRTLLGLAWVLSVGAAFWIGGMRAERPPEREPRGPARHAVADRPAAASMGAPAAAWIAARLGATEARAPEREELVPEPVLETRDTFTLDGVNNPEEASRRFMSFVATKLDEGPEGHLEILRTIDRELRNAPKLQAMFPDDRAAARFAYPWFRFLMTREGDVVAAMETVYRTAAESPDALEGIGGESLGLVTQGLATLLPGAVPDETLDRFRALAKQGIERSDELHDGIRQDLRRHFERNLEHWAKPVSREEALSKLERGQFEEAEIAELIGRLEPDDLKRVDPTSLVRPLLASRRFGAINVLASFELDARQLSRLDGEVMNAVTSGEINPYEIGAYLRSTRRTSWEQVAPFFDTGFGKSPEIAQQFGWALLQSPVGPDPDFVRRAIADHTFPDPLVRALRERYKITD